MDNVIHLRPRSGAKALTAVNARAAQSKWPNTAHGRNALFNALWLCTPHAGGTSCMSTQAAAELIEALSLAPTEAVAWTTTVDAGIPLAHSRGFVRQWWPLLHVHADHCSACDIEINPSNYGASDGRRAWCSACAHGGRA